ncbi:hypothetical protein H6P81_015239 [Aristolochia fimbriata]|uniref:Pentatricopeptide repeat-containing protein n=1 Tax=Aristolochia fimbriata TaxID=158543 RepID=A0AAV7E524_ARIFI|nr:hypothetical protein H6P81_015239 [Aristolochia fimbriata]
MTSKIRFDIDIYEASLELTKVEGSPSSEARTSQKCVGLLFPARSFSLLPSPDLDDNEAANRGRSIITSPPPSYSYYRGPPAPLIRELVFCHLHYLPVVMQMPGNPVKLCRCLTSRDIDDNTYSRTTPDECALEPVTKKKSNAETNPNESESPFLNPATQIGRMIGNKQWSASLEKEMEGLNIELNASIVNKVLKHLSDSELAFHFYSWAASRIDFKHDDVTTRLIITLLLKDLRLDYLTQILQKIKDKELSIHRSIYRLLISAYVRFNLLHLAIQTFNEMIESNCRVFSIDYNRFIGVLIRESRFDLAKHYYYKMANQGFSLSSFTYSRFISGLCKVKDIDFVQKLFDDMDKISCIPDIWAYNIYLNLLCKEKKVDMAIEVLETMILKGGEPDVVTYTTIISGFCEDGRFESAVEKWHEMIKRGFHPDNGASLALIFGLCSNGKVDVAYEVVMGMLKSHMELSSSVYNALIGGFCRAGRFDKAQVIASFMGKNGGKTDVVTYNTLMNYCCDRFMLKEAEELMSKMERKKIKPDKYSYNQLLKGLCKANQLNKAHHLLAKLFGKGRGSDLEEHALPVVQTLKYIKTIESRLPEPNRSMRENVRERGNSGDVQPFEATKEMDFAEEEKNILGGVYIVI